MDTEQGAFTPVTEAEVMSFAQRIATSLVGYSKQSEELRSASDRLAQVEAELARLRAANESLQKDVQASTDLASQAERERDLAKAEVSTWQGKATHLQDMMIGRDATVSELRQKLVAVEDKLNTVTEDRDRLENEVKTLTTQREHWHNQYSIESDLRASAEKALVKAKSDLDTIRDAHAKVFAALTVPSPVEPVEPKAEPNYSQQPEDWKPSPQPVKDDLPF